MLRSAPRSRATCSVSENASNVSSSASATTCRANGVSSTSSCSRRAARLCVTKGAPTRAFAEPHRRPGGLNLVERPRRA